LLSAARGTRCEALYVTAVHTGLRQGELLGLRWSDVDLEAGNLSVTRSLKVTADGLAFGAPKNQTSRRSVPLNKTVVSALRAHRLRQNEERLSAPEWHDHDLVFSNRVGWPTDHNNLYYREFKPLLKKAGLADQGFTFHSLRHTFATALFNRRQHKIVQSLLGYASITQTMDTYSHLLEDIGGDAVDNLYASCMSPRHPPVRRVAYADIIVACFGSSSLGSPECSKPVLYSMVFYLDRSARAGRRRARFLASCATHTLLIHYM